MALTPGARVGVYEVIASIGEGGMGQVYRARDTKLNRDVALKLLPDAFASDPDRLARFTREAQTLASLNHPHIAAIHGLEESNPSPGSGQAAVRALVMELVEGEDLSQRIARGAIPLDEALPIAKQVAEALEAAHEQGIIHRDLKPANIKMREDGTVKVLDFGLAKALEPPASSPNVSQAPTLTSPAMMTGMGVILGTAAYMSPEQAKGRPADKRGDIWAFGCVLYEMLTGKRAFEGDDVSDTLAAVLRGEPDWSALPPNLPPAIRTLVQRCLAKDRKQRIPDTSIARFLLDEHAIAALSPPQLVHSGGVWKRVVPAMIGIVVVAVIVGVAVWSLRPSTPPLPITRLSFTLPEGQQFSGTRQLVAISPDGTQMAYAANAGLYLRSMSDLEARAISGTEGAETNTVTNPIFSPDGRWIAFHSTGDRALKKIAVSGGAAVTLCPADPLFGMSWGTDGIVFGQGDKGVMRVSANGGKPDVLVNVKSDEVALGPQMLPDGQTVLFTLATGTRSDRWDKARIVVQTLKSGARKTLIEGGSNARYLPTGHIVYAVGGVLYAVPFDLEPLEVSGGPVPIVEGVRRQNFFGSAQFSVSATGTAMYIPGPVSVAPLTLGLFDQKGGGVPLKLPPGPYEAPRLSPDGKLVAFGADDGKDAIVWIYDLSGSSALRRLTFQGRNRFPIWSADGQRVAFQSDREGDLAVFWQRADGTGATERLTKPEQGTSHVPESWLPKGDRFLFSAAKESKVSLWTFSLADRKATPFDAVESSNVIGSVFSPDGRWVAYSSRETGRSFNVVYVQPFPATGAKYQITKNSEDGHHPVWSPDGKELFYPAGTGSPSLAVVRIITAPSFTIGDAMPVPRRFSGLSSAFARPHDIGPDGQFVGLIPADQSPTGTVTAPQIVVMQHWLEELKAKVPVK